MRADHRWGSGCGRSATCYPSQRGFAALAPDLNSLHNNMMRVTVALPNHAALILNEEGAARREHQDLESHGRKNRALRTVQGHPV